MTEDEDDWPLWQDIDAVEPLEKFCCPHCQVAVWHYELEGNVYTQRWVQLKIVTVQCPACLGVSVIAAKRSLTHKREPKYKLDWARLIDPPVGRSPKKFPNTNQMFLKPYEAACKILALSTEAAATMARKCLELVLIDRGYKQKRLVDKIEALLNESDPKKHLPEDIQKYVDVVRNFGNFGAHPMTDLSTHQIIDVDKGEAEWCLEIVEQLFEHYYERPAKLAEKLVQANLKLASSGKHPVKG